MNGDPELSWKNLVLGAPIDGGKLKPVTIRAKSLKPPDPDFKQSDYTNPRNLKREYVRQSSLVSGDKSYEDVIVNPKDPIYITNNSKYTSFIKKPVDKSIIDDALSSMKAAKSDATKDDYFSLLGIMARESGMGIVKEPKDNIDSTRSTSKQIVSGWTNSDYIGLHEYPKWIAMKQYVPHIYDKTGIQTDTTKVKEKDYAVRNSGLAQENYKTYLNTFNNTKYKPFQIMAERWLNKPQELNPNNTNYVNEIKIVRDTLKNNNPELVRYVNKFIKDNK